MKKILYYLFAAMMFSLAAKQSHAAGHTVSAAPNNASCSNWCGGAATATVSGGTGPFGYLWSPGNITGAVATGLCAGNYTVTVTDSSDMSTATAMVTISQFPALTASTSVTTVSCNGGSNGTATVFPSGGATPYMYSWAPSNQTTQTATGLVAGAYTITVTDANSCMITQVVTISQPAPLTISFSNVNNVSCNGGNNGSVNSVVSGGTPPYTYSWAPGGGTSPFATGLAAGSYTLAVTDANGCTAFQSVTITQPPPFSVSAGPNLFMCQGSSVLLSATVSGGPGPFSYSWSPATALASTTGQQVTASPVTTTSYTVAATNANGCTAADVVTVIVYSQMSLTSSSTPATCGNSNGTATVSVSGGTGPYSISWNTAVVQTTSTATNLTAGTYTVSVTDANGCVATTSVTVPSQPISVSTSSTPASCSQSNGSATASSTGAAPFTYLWSDGQTTATANNLAAGTYTVTVNDANSCTATGTVTITNTNAAALSFSSGNVSCFGGSNGTATVVASGGTPPYTYSWNTTPVQTTATATSLPAGVYTVSVTDAMNCISIGNVSVLQPSQLTTSVSANMATCNNVCNGTLAASVSGGTGAYSFLWSTGGNMQTQNNLCPGTYSVTVTDANGCTVTGNGTVGSAPPMVANAGPDVTICAGTSTVLTASGGLLYNWSPTASLSCGNCPTVVATPTASTTYTLTATNSAGCTATDAVTVTVVPGPIISGSSAIPATCNQSNGYASVTVSGGTPPYSYTWSPSVSSTSAASNLSVGSYTVSVNDANNQCTANAVINIQVSNAPVLSISSTNVCNNNGSATANVMGGSPPYSFAWSNGATTPAISVNSTGYYSVIVTDANGCTVSGSTYVAGSGLYLWTYGQPANCNNNGTAAVSIYGGSQPYTYFWSDGQTTSTANNLAPGTYTITVTDNNGCTGTATRVVYNNCFNIFKGRVFNDLNGNCVQDAGEIGLQGRSVQLSNNLIVYTNSAGDYQTHVAGAGTYQVSSIPNSNNPHWANTCPSPVSATFAQAGGDTTVNNFGMQMIPNVQDLRISYYTGIARPGFQQWLSIYYKNVGTIPMTGYVQLLHDSLLTYVTSTVTPSSYTHPQATWNFTNLQPGQSGSIMIWVYVPTIQNGGYLGRPLFSAASIYPIIGDTNTTDNGEDRTDTITGAFDPNDKAVNPAGIGPNGYIEETDSILRYTVRFQNTGTDTAFTIVVRDTLSPNLDINTIILGAASHPYSFEVDGRVLVWTFNNILLPDSNVNEPGSHGFLKFSVEQNAGNGPGTVMTNTADIYFDFNLPVITNTVINTIDVPTGLSNVMSNGNVLVYPNPFSDKVTIMLKDDQKEKLSLEIFNMVGQKVRMMEVSGNVFEVERKDLPSGIYMYRIIDNSSVISTGKLVAE